MTQVVLALQDQGDTGSTGPTGPKGDDGGSATGSNAQVNSLGVGTSASGTTGTIRATNDITAYYSSDLRLKENINKINEPLKKLNEINGYTFDWIENEKLHPNKGKDIGIIAQEIENIIPEIVTTRNNGYKAVRYEKIIPLLIECIKEQQKQLDILNNK